MSASIRISDDLYRKAQQAAATDFRSIPQQIEYWARIGSAALDNPELPTPFIRETLLTGEPLINHEAAEGKQSVARTGYVRELILRDQSEKSIARLRQLLLEGLESGPGGPCR
jgi:hypothetical protein